jgi:hypothetical protein
MIMLMGIIQKPTLKSYFSKNPILDTPIFGRTMTQGKFKSITKFFHFVDNATQDSYSGRKKLFKIHPVLTYLNNKFQTVYIPGENDAVD